GKYCVFHAWNDPAYSRTFVGSPFFLIFSHGGSPDLSVQRKLVAFLICCRNAAMMQGYDFPTVVKYRRARRARFGIGSIMKEIIKHIDDLIFAQCKHFHSA